MDFNSDLIRAQRWNWRFNQISTLPMIYYTKG